MSTLKVNKITNANDDGPIEFTTGAIIARLDSETINATGIITATAFIGDGSNLTGFDAFLSKGQVVSVSNILS